MTAAPINIASGARLCVSRNAIARPGNTVWLIASPIMLIRRSTSNAPGNAHATAHKLPMTIVQVSLISQFIVQVASRKVTSREPFGMEGTE